MKASTPNMNDNSKMTDIYSPLTTRLDNIFEWISPAKIFWESIATNDTGIARGKVYAAGEHANVMIGSNVACIRWALLFVVTF